VTEPSASPGVGPLVEHLFRRQYARMVAGLTRVFGAASLELVEDIVQEALVRALRVWPFEGVPREPEAWLVQAARNAGIDVVRRRKMAARKQAELEHWAAQAAGAQGDALPQEIADDTLRLMFTACHPSLGAEARVALTLKTLCGFGVAEIARALLAKEATVAQRLTRAKAQLQREAVAFEMPPPGELRARLDSVLDVLYLLFNEGYAAAQGDELVRGELVNEAIRLAELLLVAPETALPKVHAVLALFAFQAARIPARVGVAGELLVMAEQDRALWDRRAIAAGFAHFTQCMAGDELTPWHLEAAIASCHAAAPTYAQTDWRQILRHYDALLGLVDSPIVRLNRAVALAKVDGLTAARRDLDALAASGALREYYLLPATSAHLAWSAGEREPALAAFTAALACACSAPERALLERRIAACRSGAPAPSL
jgi:RNA polymerase sigma factor (sigma-70 family)